MLPRLLLLSTWQPMHTCVCCCLSTRVVDTLKNFLNSVLPIGRRADMISICSALLGVQRTKDGLSLIIVLKSWFIAPMGLNFVGAMGVGKKARNVRSKSRVAKLFVVVGVVGVEDALRACCVSRGGPAVTGCAMVGRGGSVFNPRRLT